MASNFKRTPFTLTVNTLRLFQCVCVTDRHVFTHTIILPLPAASQGKITLGPSVTMGGGCVGPHLPFQPLHKREEEITEDPHTLIQQMRKHSHRRGASMDSFLAPHRLEGVWRRERVWREGEGECSASVAAIPQRQSSGLFICKLGELTCPTSHV